MSCPGWDALDPGTGRDRVDGAGGDDTIVYSRANALEGGAGRNVIRSGSGDDIVVRRLARVRAGNCRASLTVFEPDIVNLEPSIGLPLLLPRLDTAASMARGGASARRTR